MIPVRVTAVNSALATDADVASATPELLAAIRRGGLLLDGDMTWFATQEELDTPHVNFRLSPR